MTRFEAQHRDLCGLILSAITEKIQGEFWYVVMAVQHKLTTENIKAQNREIIHVQETLNLLHAITGMENIEDVLVAAGIPLQSQQGSEIMKNTKSQSLLGAILQLGIEEGEAQGLAKGLAKGRDEGKILNLYELAQKEVLTWEAATQFADMGTDTALFKRTARQYQVEEAQRPSAQAM